MRAGTARSGVERSALWLGFSALLASGLFAWFASSPATATPANLRSLQEHYGQFLGKGLNNCLTCHVAAAAARLPTTLADFPHNAFGRRMAAARDELRAAGRRTDIASRLRTVAGEDSDGDGVANEVELLAGTKPGDAASKPNRDQLAAVTRRRPAFAAFLNSYHWRPFEPVKRPAVPRVRDARWVRNPIDAFIAAERERRGLKPRPEASREILLRRVYLDLIGLSPTPEEVGAFLADRSPDAYEKVVDRLLASPRYGERWGRHWMDVWRYSDWTGYGDQIRDSQPHIWRWRDWIVESMNEDNGYGRMILEMLAADELDPLNANALRATGFLVRNYKLLSREKWMQDTVDHTAQAFLGITLGCARCHNHMYDPISQREYYQFRAVFEPHQVRTDWVPGQLDRTRDGLPRAFDANPEAPTYLYVRGDERQPVKDDPLRPGVPESLGGRLAIEPVPLPLLGRFPEKQPHVIAALRTDAAAKVEQARKTLEACTTPAETVLAQLKLEAAAAGQAALEAVLRAEELEDAGQKDADEWKEVAGETALRQRQQAVAEGRVRRLEAARALDQLSSSARPEQLKTARDNLAAAEAALAQAEGDLAKPVTTAYRPRVTSNHPPATTGRRLALARWIASPDNPLTARVAMNQIWMRHFGQAIVPTVADFGRNGAPPSHPQLLDWLAATLVAHGWRMKPVHRLIVTSSVYRMASTTDAANLAKDPDNRFLWRMNSRRMEAEVVRDNVLYVSGQLDLTMGGPEIDQNLGLTAKRRSIYFRTAPEKEMVFLNLFDGPNPVECYARKQTVVPQQALALANSEIALTQARLLARALVAQTGPDPAEFTRVVFLRVLARAPTKAEMAECVTFLNEQTNRLAGIAPAPGSVAATASDASKPSPDPAVRARENLALVLLNHNGFVHIR